MVRERLASSLLDIRFAKLEEMPFIIDLAAKEGWNPGLHDSDCFYRLDPEGFLIGELAGEKIGCISAVKYQKQFGFIGFYIVQPPYRGQGFGIQLWQRAMQLLGDRNIGLDGVVDQQNNYKKSGFQFAYRNLRFEGIIPGRNVPEVTPLTHISLDEISIYDRQCFPESRKEFLYEWMRTPNTYAYGIKRNEKLVGYGVIRKCLRGYKIGPLFADHLEDADALLQALCYQVHGAVVFLDIPEVNLQALELPHIYGMKKVFETARMYTKEFPAIDLNKVYGLTTPEIG